MENKAIKMYWWNQGQNFGDVMNPKLVNGLSGLDVEWSNSPGENVFTGAGSLIDPFHIKDGWTVWGAGAITPHVNIPKALTILAVRGERTRELLVQKGYTDTPEVYGDPGLLLPGVMPMRATEKKYDLGIIPHTSYRRNPYMYLFLIKSLLKKFLRRNASISIKIISPKLEVEEFISEVNSCKLIAANSLHGLITALAYKVPAAWIRFVNDPLEGKVTSPFVGGTYKYYDFLSALNIYDYAPIDISSMGDFSRVLDGDSVIENIVFDPVPLLKAFPYKTDTFIQKEQELIEYYAQG